MISVIHESHRGIYYLALSSFEKDSSCASYCPLAEAINEVLSFLVEHPDLLDFVAILAAATAGEELPGEHDAAAIEFFEGSRQRLIDADRGALGFVRWARGNPDELLELKRILFAPPQ